MGVSLQPVAGEWYQTVSGECFEVVAYDPEEQTIEIQYFDGAIAELDLDAWLEMPLVAAEPPEDWSGSMDVMREDFSTDADVPSAHDGYNFLDDVDQLS